MNPDDSLDPDAPASAEETTEAEDLRRALERGPQSRGESAAAELARAISLAHTPRPIGEAEHGAIVARAVARGEARRPRTRSQRLGGVITIGGGLALAAAIFLVVRTRPEGGPPTPAAASPAAASLEPLVPVRSTQPLFREPFAKTGGESARIDRITASRGADLRDNRFAAWGVR
jgi:hypothetical protein